MKHHYSLTFSCTLMLCVVLMLSAKAEDRYWVGGSGTWDATATANWSTSSGGASGASVPTSIDNVFFDANSFTANNQTVNALDYLECLNMDWTGAATTYSNPAFSQNSYQLSVYGSLTFIAGMTATMTSGSLVFWSTSVGNTITAATQTFGNITFVGDGGEYTLQDALTCSIFRISASGATTSVATNGFALTCSSGINIETGTLTTSGSTITTPYINASLGGANSIDLGASTVNITGSVSTTYSQELIFSASTTVIPGTSTINFTGANNNMTDSPIEIYFGSETLYNLTFPSGKFLILWYDGGIMNNVTLNANNILILESTQTFAINGTLTATGDCQNYLSIMSETGGSAAIITTGIAQNINYVNLKDITETVGGNSITCDYCVNAGTNTNITMTNTYAARTLYWMGTGSGSGNWGTGTNWTTNAGGTGSGNTCVPTMVDNVYFNASSFDASGQTLTIDNSMFFNDMIWTGTANSPAFLNSASDYPMFCTGSITLTSGIGTFTNEGRVNLNGTGNQLITSAGKTLNSADILFSGGGTYYLEDDLTLGTVCLKSGTLDVQNLAGSTVNNLNVLGNWNYTGGTWNPRSDASKYVVFWGSSNSNIMNTTTFYNLKLNKTDNTYYVLTVADVTITNELKISGGGYYYNLNYTTNVAGTIDISCAACTLSVAGGNFNYTPDSPTGFVLATGKILIGGTCNVGGTGTTHTNLLIGDASGSGDATLEVSGGTINIKDRLLVKSDGIFDVSGGITNIKSNTTSGGTAATAKWQMDASSEFKMSGGTINVNGPADNNTTSPISFNTASVFTAANITGGTVVLKSNFSTYNCVVDFNGKTLFNLTLTQASRTFKQVNNPVTLKGQFAISTSTTYDANAQDMFVAGNWWNNGTYSNTGAANTVTFNGTSVMTGTSATSFYNVTITGSLKGRSAGNFNVRGNWTNNGTYDHFSGTATFNGTSALTITGSASTTFYNLNLNNASGVTLGIGQTIADGGYLNLISGYHDLASYTLQIGVSAKARLIYTSGGLYSSTDNGSLKRYIPDGATEVTSSTAGSYLGLFPFKKSDTEINVLELNSTSDVTTGGFITATPTFATTVTDVADYADDHATILKIQSGKKITIALTTIDGGTFTQQISGGFFDNGTLADYTLVTYNSVAGTGNYVGTYAAASNTASYPVVSRTGIPTASLADVFAIGTYSADTPLPIELIIFTGKKNDKNNELFWITATEENNDYFSIEKTYDGIHFELVGNLDGSGNSTSEKTYSIIDSNVKNAINYYRLKQTDFDGKTDYSKIISIDNTETGSVTKEVLTITNLLGQEVNNNYRGLVLITYTDGSSVKAAIDDK